MIQLVTFTWNFKSIRGQAEANSYVFTTTCKDTISKIHSLGLNKGKFSVYLVEKGMRRHQRIYPYIIITPKSSVRTPKRYYLLYWWKSLLPYQNNSLMHCLSQVSDACRMGFISNKTLLHTEKAIVKISVSKPW